MKSLIETSGAQRILIVGDAGRGKTTFAKHIAHFFDIQAHSLDDILWKEKYSKIEDRPVAIEKITQVVGRDSWVIEGATRYLAEYAFDRADYIFHFEHRMFLGQMWHLIRRFISRREGTVKELLSLILHSIYKRYSIGYCLGRKRWSALLEPHAGKVVKVQSRRDLRRLFES